MRNSHLTSNNLKKNKNKKKKPKKHGSSIKNNESTFYKNVKN